MRSGRPPSWNIVEGFDDGAWTGLAELSSKDRLLIPSSVRRRLTWLSRTTDQQVLAEIEGDGVVALRPWLPYGPELQEHLRATMATAAEADRHVLSIAAMDRFARLSIGSDGRAVLPLHLCLHLDVAEFDAVRLVCMNNELRMWSEHHWRQKRAQRHDRLIKALGR